MGQTTAAPTAIGQKTIVAISRITQHTQLTIPRVIMKGPRFRLRLACGSSSSASLDGGTSKSNGLLAGGEGGGFGFVAVTLSAMG
jgi:hypothetical protein